MKDDVLQSLSRAVLVHSKEDLHDKVGESWLLIGSLGPEDYEQLVGDPESRVLGDVSVLDVRGGVRCLLVTFQREKSGLQFRFVLRIEKPWTRDFIASLMHSPLRARFYNAHTREACEQVVPLAPSKAVSIASSASAGKDAPSVLELAMFFAELLRPDTQQSLCQFASVNEARVGVVMAAVCSARIPSPAITVH